MENADIARRRWSFLAGLLLVAVMGVVFAVNDPLRLAPYVTGLVAGAILCNMLRKWALAVRTAQALEHVQEILDDAAERAPLTHESKEYALANGIMHGLRYLNLCRDPGRPDSEFQVMCNEAEREAKRSA